MIPRSIELLGKPYKIRRKRMKEHAWIDYDKQTIWIRSGLSAEAAESSLLHECIHGILFQSGNGYMLQTTVEESIVRSLEHGLWQAGFRLLPSAT